MYGATLAACFALCMGSALATTLGTHSSDGSFCYKEADGCGPSTWPGVCTEGSRQSPINLPKLIVSTGAAAMDLSSYKGNAFRMANNGHSVTIDFQGATGTNAATKTFSFPDPEDLYNTNKVRKYKFASAHFHWGVKDYLTGSEHKIGGRASAMELHLVHYLANYTDMATAVSSGDPNALSVLGVLIDVSIVKNIMSGLSGLLSQQPKSHVSLAPIVKNLQTVTTAHHEPEYKSVSETLDFTRLLKTPGPTHMFTYRGSLTTPGCNEQVNWYVLKEPATTTSADLDKFRSSLKDDKGEALRANHRPIQPRNGRKIRLSIVVPR